MVQYFQSWYKICASAIDLKLRIFLHAKTRYFSYFCCGTNWKGLAKAPLISTYNICFSGEIRKIFSRYHFYLIAGFVFVLKFYDPVNLMGSCRTRSVYLITRLRRGLNPRPPGLQSDAHPTEPPRPALIVDEPVYLEASGQLGLI